MTSIEQNRYDSCKLKVKNQRTNRNKNKPTPCLKNPTDVGEGTTDEDYNVLWDGVNEQLEKNAGLYMNTVLPLSEFVDKDGTPLKPKVVI